MEDFISRDNGVFTGKEKSYLKQGEFMSMGDCLFSPDGCWKLTINDNAIFVYRYDKDAGFLIVTWDGHFSKKVQSCHAIMQDDGNFCIYEGNDPEHRGELLWQVGVNTGKIATLQRDGNFCLFNTYSPEFRPGCLVWECGNQEGAAERYEILDVEYDYDNVVKQPPVFVTAFSQILNNQTEVEQESEVGFTIKETEKHYWENKSGTSLTVKGSISYGIPFGPKVGIEISGQFSDESISGSEVVTEKVKTYTVPVKIPPKSAIKVVATIAKNTLQIPYKYIGRFIVSGGLPSYCNLVGNFIVNDSSELQVGYMPMEQSVKTRSVISNENCLRPDNNEALILIDKKLIKENK